MSEPEDKHVRNIEERVTRTEAEIAALSQDVQRLQSTVGDLARSVNDGFTSLNNTIGEHQKTRWSPIVAGGALVVLILSSLITLGSSGPLSDVQELKQAVHQNHRDFIEHMADGHPERLDNRITKLEKADVDLDTILQREMRILDDILQREIKLNRELVERDIQRLEDLIEVNEETFSNMTDDRYPASRAMQDLNEIKRRLEALEKRGG